VLIGWLPFLNAVSDWVSINVTRPLVCSCETKRREAQHKSGEGKLSEDVIPWFYILIDFFAALLLTLLLYALTIGVYAGLEKWGWGTSARRLLESVAESQYKPETIWFLLLAFTNFIPTVLHWGLWATDKLYALDKDFWLDIQKYLDENGHHTHSPLGGDLGSDAAKELHLRQPLMWLVTVFFAWLLFIAIAYGLPFMARWAAPYF
jgi:hypothetical protein